MKKKEIGELSFFDESQERQIGEIFQDYLNEGGKIANVQNSFIVGKYNMNLESQNILFCGQFQGKPHWYFIGTINGIQIIDWGLATDERPKLCAISEIPIHFSFDKSAIVRQ